jgi:hypothetical protein
MLKALPLFEGLQRLRLFNDVRGQAETLLRTPALDLRSLQHLRWVSLTDISPSSFRLDASCALRVELQILIEGLAGNGWPHVQPNIPVKYLSWENESVVLTRLPRFTRASSLTHVKLQVSSIGAVDSPLVIPTPLRRLQRLHLLANYVCLELPGNVQWTDADINAGDTLLLKFEDSSAFVDYSEALSLQYGSFSGSGLIDLCRALSASDRQYYSTCNEVGSWMMTLGKYEVSVVEDQCDNTPIWAEDCSCRVCIKCITEARYAL